MRQNESELVMGALERLGLRLILVDASETFTTAKLPSTEPCAQTKLILK